MRLARGQQVLKTATALPAAFVKTTVHVTLTQQCLIPLILFHTISANTECSIVWIRGIQSIIGMNTGSRFFSELVYTLAMVTTHKIPQHVQSHYSHLKRGVQCSKFNSSTAEKRFELWHCNLLCGTPNITNPSVITVPVIMWKYIKVRDDYRKSSSCQIMDV